MRCWMCKRNQEDLQQEGFSDHEFEEFEISGKNINLCEICNSLLEEVAISTYEEIEEGFESEEDEYDDEEGMSLETPTQPYLG